MKKTGLVALTIAIFWFQTAVAQDNRSDGPPRTPSVEERLKMVERAISKETPNLNPEKKKMIVQTFKSFFLKMEELRKSEAPPPPPPPMDAKTKQKMDQLIKEREEKIASFLTQEEFSKYHEVEQKLRPKHGQHPPRPEAEKE